MSDLDQAEAAKRLLLLTAARERLRAHLEQEAEALLVDLATRRQVERLAEKLREGAT